MPRFTAFIAFIVFIATVNVTVANTVTESPVFVEEHCSVIPPQGQYQNGVPVLPFNEWQFDGPVHPKLTGRQTAFGLGETVVEHSGSLSTHVPCFAATVTGLRWNVHNLESWNTTAIVSICDVVQEFTLIPGDNLIRGFFHNTSTTAEEFNDFPEPAFKSSSQVNRLRKIINYAVADSDGHDYLSFADEYSTAFVHFGGLTRAYSPVLFAMAESDFNPDTLDFDGYDAQDIQNTGYVTLELYSQYDNGTTTIPQALMQNAAGDFVNVATVKGQVTINATLASTATLEFLSTGAVMTVVSMNASYIIPAGRHRMDFPIGVNDTLDFGNSTVFVLDSIAAA